MGRKEFKSRCRQGWDVKATSALLQWEALNLPVSKAQMEEGTNWSPERSRVKKEPYSIVVVGWVKEEEEKKHIKPYFALFLPSRDLYWPNPTRRQRAKEWGEAVPRGQPLGTQSRAKKCREWVRMGRWAGGQMTPTIIFFNLKKKIPVFQTQLKCIVSHLYKHNFPSVYIFLANGSFSN